MIVIELDSARSQQPSRKWLTVAAHEFVRAQFDCGAESADVCQPRATPWGSELVGGALNGQRIPPPFQGGTYTRTRPRGVAPGMHATRRWRVIAAEFSNGESYYDELDKLLIARPPIVEQCRRLEHGGSIGVQDVACGYQFVEGCRV
jgi:hypothetical protein